jgi:hypothetical protein
MKKIRFKETFSLSVDGVLRGFSAGDVRDYLSDAIADSLISAGKAELVLDGVRVERKQEPIEDKKNKQLDVSSIKQVKKEVVAEPEAAPKPAAESEQA